MQPLMPGSYTGGFVALVGQWRTRGVPERQRLVVSNCQQCLFSIQGEDKGA